MYEKAPDNGAERGRNTTEDREENIMRLILSAGNARSFAIEAYRKARLRSYAEAEYLMKQADEAIDAAHVLQTEMITDELNGSASGITMLAVHAQDHTMNALTVIDLVREMILTMKEERDEANHTALRAGHVDRNADEADACRSC
ncbi:MAG: PTS lactose/cellobiose transporter subunit IIA [Solobacterium sp.]|nr:PTS lactose/cellobiose transporter subunit IIA [Solobacterium sp.]